MKHEVKNVKEILEAKYRHMRFDTDVLSNCVTALSPIEFAVVGQNRESMTESLRPHFDYVILKLYNRYMDTILGKTLFYHDCGVLKVRLSTLSSVTELIEDFTVYEDLRSSGVSAIKDLKSAIAAVVPEDTLAKAESVYQHATVENFAVLESLVLDKE